MRESEDEGGRSQGRSLSSWILPTAVVLAALLIRVLAIGVDGAYEPRHDAYDYDRHARSISAGDGFPESDYVPDGGPSALRGPAYPFALGAVYAVSGDSITAGRMFGALLGALTVLLLYLLTRRIWGPRIALIAASLAAAFPPLILISTELYSENLFIPLLLGAVLAVVRYRESSAIRWAALAGVLAGLAALTRGPGVIALLPLILGLWMIRPRLGIRALVGPLTAIACAVLVIAPWTARNAVEFGRLIPIATSTGFGLAGTYNEDSLNDPSATAAWRTPAIADEYAPLFRTAGVDEGTLDATLRRESVSFVADHPGYAVEAMLNNALRLAYLKSDSVVAFGQEIDETGIGNRGTTTEVAAFVLAFVLAAVGLLAIAAGRRNPELPETGRMPAVHAGPIFLWLVPMALILVALPVAGLPRYRVPADPFLLILAAIGLAWLRDRRSIRRLAVAAGVLIAVAAIGGCGDGDGSASTPASGSAPVESPGADPEAKAAYIERADRICAQALADAEDLVGSGDLPMASADALELTTKGLIAPGIEIRARQSERLRALEIPGDDENLDRFLGLFDSIEELSRQRLRAGLAGDADESQDLERLLGTLAAEQQEAAKAYGFDDCSKDVIGEAFR